MNTVKCSTVVRIAGLAVFSMGASMGTQAAADFQPLGGLPGGAPHRGSTARAVSADGSVIVGGSESAAGYMEAFRWTRETGMLGLGYLPGGFSSYANAVSADGAVVVGGGNSATGPKTAFIWSKDKGMQPLAEVLASSGAKNVAGWTLEEATGVSADGKTVIGVGQSPEGFSEDFAAVIGLEADTAPDTFAFTDQDDVAPSTMITSKPVTITGINTGAPVTIGDGEYSLGCTGKFTAVASTVRPGETICVRHMSSAKNATATNTMLTIGRIADTFTSTTVEAKDDEGGSALDGFSLLTLGLFGLHRWRRQRLRPRR